MTTQVEEPRVEILTEPEILAVVVPKGQAHTSVDSVAVAKHRFDTLIAEQLRTYTAQAMAMLLDAQTFTIQTPEDYKAAAQKLKETKTIWKTIEDGRKVFTVPLNAILDHINAQIKTGIQTIVKETEEQWKALLKVWDDEQKRLRREAQAKADEAARVEQERLNRLAEQRAARAEAKGDPEKAQEIRESVPTVMPAAVTVAETPKVKGLSYRDDYDFEIVDVAAFITGVACGDIPQEAIEINRAYVKKAANALKESLQWPGGRVVKSRILASGRA